MAAAFQTLLVVFSGLNPLRNGQVACTHSHPLHRNCTDIIDRQPLAICEVLPREAWSYKTTSFSLATEFDLACTGQWQVPFSAFCFFFGVLLGCALWQLASEKWGEWDNTLALAVTLALHDCTRLWRQDPLTDSCSHVHASATCISLGRMHAHVSLVLFFLQVAAACSTLRPWPVRCLESLPALRPPCGCIASFGWPLVPRWRAWASQPLPSPLRSLHPPIALTWRSS